jgi:hypothetical protein
MTLVPEAALDYSTLHRLIILPDNYRLPVPKSSSTTLTQPIPQVTHTQSEVPSAGKQQLSHKVKINEIN